MQPDSDDSADDGGGDSGSDGDDSHAGKTRRVQKVGLHWQPSEGPSGIEIFNDGLQKALDSGRMEFTEDELDGFKIQHLTWSSFVRTSDGRCFKPLASGGKPTTLSSPSLPPAPPPDTFGLRWEETEKPENGTEIKNAALREALESGQTSFTRSELKHFKLGDIPRNAYIWTQVWWFKPAHALPRHKKPSSDEDDVQWPSVDEIQEEEDENLPPSPSSTSDSQASQPKPAFSPLNAAEKATAPAPAMPWYEIVAVVMMALIALFIFFGL